MKRALLAAALAAAGLAAATAPAQTQAVLPTEQVAKDKREREMRRAVATGMLTKPRRSRGPQAKPKKRPNRNTISKRARRKHRRAA